MGKFNRIWHVSVDKPVPCAMQDYEAYDSIYPKPEYVSEDVSDDVGEDIMADTFREEFRLFDDEIEMVPGGFMLPEKSVRKMLDTMRDSMRDKAEEFKDALKKVSKWMDCGVLPDYSTGDKFHTLKVWPSAPDDDLFIVSDDKRYNELYSYYDFLFFMGREIDIAERREPGNRGTFDLYVTGFYEVKR